MRVMPNGVFMMQAGDKGFMTPVMGGCWFSSRDERFVDEQWFDSEFDTWVDPYALKLALNHAKLEQEKDEHHRSEALLMEYLFEDYSNDCKDNPVLTHPIVKFSELTEAQYLQYGNQIISKRKATELLQSGEVLDHYFITVTEEYIQGLLDDLGKERKEGEEIPEFYAAPNNGSLVWVDKWEGRVNEG